MILFNGGYMAIVKIGPAFCVIIYYYFWKKSMSYTLERSKE